MGANWAIAKSFFTKSPLSYAEYKQQCASLRIFAVSGITLGCVLGLFLNPPKSSYWVRYGPGYWLYHITGALSTGQQPLFLTKKVERADTKDIVKQLITTRRLVGQDDA